MIEETLKREMDILYSMTITWTAIITVLLSMPEIAEKNIENVRVVFSEQAAIACAKLASTE